MKKIFLRNPNNHGEKFSVTVDVKDGANEIMSKVVEARSKSELDSTLANILALANQVETDFAAITEGEWTPAPKATPEPTTQESLIQTAEMELYTAVETAKREKEVADMAAVDTDVKAKLDALKALKAQ